MNYKGIQDMTELREVKTWPKCICGGVPVYNASGDLSRTCISCSKIVRPITTLKSVPKRSDPPAK